MTYAQQLQLLQNSAFYQSLTSNQKLMLNQEIATKADQSVANDPILTGILSNLGLMNSANHNNGSATSILANVNSLVPMNANINQNVMPNTIAPNLGPMGMLPLGANAPNPNMLNNPGMGAPGLLGAAPGLPVMPNMPGNDFQINFDPRNGGLLGNAPFQNFPDNQNFGNFNDEYFEDGNFNFNRNDRNFRDRGQSSNRRGRSWNNRHNNNRNYNRNNNNRNRSNRSYTPP